MPEIIDLKAIHLIAACLLVMLLISSVNLAGQITVKKLKDNKISKNFVPKNKNSALLYFYKDSIFIRERLKLRLKKARFKVTVQNDSILSVYHSLRIQDFPFYSQPKSDTTAYEATAFLKNASNIDTIQIETESGELLYRLDSLYKEDKKNKFKLSKIESPVKGKVVFRNDYYSNPIARNGQTDNFNSSVRLELSAADLGIPVKASLTYGDYPYTQRFTYNIELDTSALRTDSLESAMTNSFEQYKDSTLKETYSMEGELDQLKNEKYELMSDYDTSSVNYEFASSKQDSIDALEYANYDYQMDTSLSKDEKKRIENIDQQIATLERQINTNKSGMKHDSTMKNDYNMREYDTSMTNYGDYNVNRYDSLNVPTDFSINRILKSISVLEIGNIYPTFSPFLIKDYPLMGAQLGFSAFKRVHFLGYYGNRSTAFYAPNEETSYGLSLGVDVLKGTRVTIQNVNNHGKYSSESYNFVSSNSILGMGLSQQLTKYVKFEGEVAFSDLVNQKNKEYNIPKLFSSENNGAFKLGFSLQPWASTNIKLDYYQTEANYLAKSSPYMWPNSSTISSSLGQRLFNNKFKFDIKYSYSTRGLETNFKSSRHNTFFRYSTKFKKPFNFSGHFNWNLISTESILADFSRKNEMNIYNAGLGINWSKKIRKTRSILSVFQMYNKQSHTQIEFQPDFYSTNFTYSFLSKKFNFNASYILNYSISAYHLIGARMSYKLTKGIQAVYDGSISGGEISTISRNLIGVIGSLDKLKIRYSFKAGGITIKDEVSFVAKTRISYSF